MPSFHASAFALCAGALAAATVLAGCTSMRLAPEPPPGVRLAGDWKLDPALSDDLGRAVAQLRAQSAKAHRGTGAGQPPQIGAYRRRRGGGPGGQQEGGEATQDDTSSGPESAAQGVGTAPAPGSSPVDQLMSSVPRGDYLKIKVSSSAFTVVSGDSSDEYTPGLESDITAEQGDAEQVSGWKGAEYVIDTRPQWGAEIIQSYGLTREGRLTMTIRLTGGGTKFTFTRVYDRTTQVAPLAPPTNN